MMRIRVQPSGKPSGRYSACIAALGYERRARHISEVCDTDANIRVAAGFDVSRTLSYNANQNWFDANGFEVPVVSDGDFRAWAESLANRVVQESLHDADPARVLIDISSFSRVRMAALISAFADASATRKVELELAYSIAKYNPPPAESSEIVIAEPVLGRFAGWCTEPDKPVAAVVGAGYEKDRAVGIVEYLEAADVWAWMPRGLDKRFDTDVDGANDSLSDYLHSDRALAYDITAPFDTFLRLESLCYGLMRDFRPVVVPFGPKMFMAIALLVALHWPKHLSVWRVSGGSRDVPVDRHADGNIVSLKVVMDGAVGERSQGIDASLAVPEIALQS